MTRLAPTFLGPQTADYERRGGPYDLPVDDVLAAGGAAAVDPDRALDASGLAAYVDAVAGGLRAAGVGIGDAVLWQYPNGIDALALARACWRIGAVAVPLHHLAGDADRARARALVQPALDLIEVPAPPTAASPDAPTDDGTPIPPDGMGVVLFTAGSTGGPKAVLHTRRALAYKARLMAATHGLTAADVVLMPAPLAHISGLLNAVLVAGAADMTAVLMPKWNADTAIDLIAAHHVSYMVGPPTFFIGLMESPRFTPERVASLRVISSGGAGVSPAFVQRAGQELGARVKRSYGSTEAPTMATTAAEDPVTHDADCDGHPVGAAELRLDPTNGELQVRGPEVFVGYADATENDGVFTADGWYRTGDLATIDADGFLAITGRLKDVIIRGGENIPTGTVEATLEAHPAVRAAVAVGYPDELMGERVCAFVVAADPDGPAFDVAAARTWFEERGIARFMAPERVEIVTEFPLLPSGKPDRVALRALAAR